MNATLANPGEARAQAPPELGAHALNGLRQRMHEQVGVVRDAKGLGATLDWIGGSIDATGPARALVAAKLIVAAALARKESRGGHYRSDFPQAATPHRTFLRAGPDGEPLIQHSAVAEGS